MMVVIMWVVMRGLVLTARTNGDKCGDSISNGGEWYKNRKKNNSFIQLPSNLTLINIRNILTSNPTLFGIRNILL